MSERFFTATPIASDRITLAGGEAHHLAHVMRKKPGAMVTLFDGSGQEFDARIESVAGDVVELTIVERRSVAGRQVSPLVLAVALPKGDRQRWLVEKAVELGVESIVPLVVKRSVALPVDSALVRLRRTAIEASKQCGRNQILEIAEARKWHEFVAEVRSSLRLLAHPGGKPLASVWPAGEPPQESIVAAIGPEGGFADDEAQAALDAGWTPVDLGPLILRVETAAVAIAAWAMLAHQGGASRVASTSPSA